MKKLLTIAVCTSISFAGLAQKQAIQSANNYLSDKDYDHALEYIEKALKDPSTANDPKAWYVRGNIYMEMQGDPKRKDSKPYQEAAKSYMKVIEIKPNYDKDAVRAITTNLINCAYTYYNDGVAAFNSDKIPAKYEDAKQLMQNVVDIHDFEVKHSLQTIPQFDTVAMTSKYIVGTCYYDQNKYAEALPILTEAKNSGMVKSVDIYVHIADIYEKQNKPDDRLAIINEGRKAFPKDESLKAMEINYYIKAGKTDALVSKLEESAKEHPDNPEIWFNLGTIYMNMANPKEGTAPANAADLNTKAEAAYTQAIKLDPDNVDYNYNIGAMYFNQGVDVSEKMNAITGTSAADNKKYDDLSKVMLQHFAQAEPYLEKCLSILDARKANMKKDDKATYLATVQSLRDIYNKEKKADKASDMTKRLQGGN